MTDTRTCTCHPDDFPPIPCPRKFALTDCRAAAGGYDPFTTPLDDPRNVQAIAEIEKIWDRKLQETK